MIRILHVDVFSEALRARIEANLARQEQPELSAIHLVHDTRDLTAAMPRFVTAFIEARRAARAFSSEVDTGSREENASKQEVEPRSASIGTEKALEERASVLMSKKVFAISRGGLKPFVEPFRFDGSGAFHLKPHKTNEKGGLDKDKAEKISRPTGNA